MERTVKYLCPADAIPPFIEVDLSMLDIGQKILLKDLKVGSNLQLLQNDGSFPVCKIMGSRGAAAAAAAAAAS
jgi:large subunit ribosomal protein L25